MPTGSGLKRGVGRPPVYADAPLVFKGVALHPQQACRIHDAARRRGVTFTAMMRTIVEDWERTNGLAEVPAK